MSRNKKVAFVAGKVDPGFKKRKEVTAEDIAKRYVANISDSRNGVLAGFGFVWARVTFTIKGNEFKYYKKVKKSLSSATDKDKRDFFNGLYLDAINQIK